MNEDEIQYQSKFYRENTSYALEEMVKNHKLLEALGVFSDSQCQSRK